MASTSPEHIHQMFNRPLFELVAEAHHVRCEHFEHDDMECCTLSSIKTGGCPEDCAYCPQSAHYSTGLKRQRQIDVEDVLEQAKIAKASGAQRFCMGAAWRSPPVKDLPVVCALITSIRAMGLETCATLGTLSAESAQRLNDAGLDVYNHNLDTSETYYQRIITTRTYQERLTTLKHAHNAGLRLCCGGILGMGESRDDRVQLLATLLHLPGQLFSLPINQLIPIPGTPLEHAEPLDPFEIVRTVAVAHLLFPRTRIRLAAGREGMTASLQAWCFMAGANSIFLGERLLTAANPQIEHDLALLASLSYRLPRQDATTSSTGDA